jgi:hypothetical protein
LDNVPFLIFSEIAMDFWLEDFVVKKDSSCLTYNGLEVPETFK